MSDWPVSAVVASIPERAPMLARALFSVASQTWPVSAIHVAVDVDREGAAVTRDRALAAVTTEWVAFLDDDDEWYPHHIETLVMAAMDVDADWFYPWFDVDGGVDPFPQFFGAPWDNDNPHQTTVTVLARTEAVRAAGGFTGAWDPALADDPGVDEDGNRAGEEYQLVLRLLGQGHCVVHVPERTWRWYHHQGNTSGLPSRRRLLTAT